MPQLVYLTDGTTQATRMAPATTFGSLASGAKLVRSEHGWAVQADEGPWAGSFLGWFDEGAQPGRAWGMIQRIPRGYRICRKTN